jgi:hypothetical protein
MPKHLINTQGMGKGDTLLFVPKAEALNRVPLREPTHANMLIPVRRDDVRLTGCEDECSEEGSVP